MTGFRATLATQRWDDHRYYHHSLVNQSLHLLSATSFLCAYVVLFFDPAIAALIAWTVSMTSRQIGHFFFEPKTYDHINQATHEFKEAIKVGYNLRRKVVLHAIWGVSPIAVYCSPTLFGLMRPWHSLSEFLHHLGWFWLVIGIAGLIFRSVQLFLRQDWQTGVAWAVKIMTDPFHDVKLYYKAPYQLLRRDIDDEDDIALGHSG